MNVAMECDENQPILGYSFTIGWLLDSLRKHDRFFLNNFSHRTVAKVDAVDISVGKGFVSSVLRCLLTFTDSANERDTYSTVLKIPSIQDLENLSQRSGLGEHVDTDFRRKVVAVHNCEATFYAHIAPHLTIPLPRFFAHVEWIYEQQEGVIHMEDLSAVGKTLSTGKRLSISQIRSVVRVLAQLNVEVWRLPEAEWRPLFPGSWDILKQGVKLMRAGETVFLQICKREDEFQPLLNACLPILTSEKLLHYVYFESWKEEYLKPVLAHGDCWSGNLLWRSEANDGEVGDELAAVVDWQMTFTGSPMADLARLLVISTNSATRRFAETEIFDFYLDCLRQFLPQGQKVPYTREQLRRSYRLHVLTQAGYHTVTAPMMVTRLGKLWGKSQLEELINSMIADAQLLWQDVQSWMETDLKDVKERFSFVNNK